ncbi:hypothetical protein MKX01_041216 [Papaver californicum]|nr:hypothetical protein MKX01_041216 [Papaver californicum]
MEKHQGDLSDILRVCGGGNDGISCTSTGKNKLSAASPSWEFPTEPIKFSTAMEEPIDNFGDPFSCTRDPLLHDLDLAVVGGGIFDNSTSSSSVDPTVSMNISEGDMIISTTAANNNNSVCSNLLAQRILDEEIMKRPNCHVFSRMLQLSPNVKRPISSSPRDLSSSSAAATASSSRENSSLNSTTQLIVTHDMINGINISSGCGSLNNSSIQISSPRYNHTGVKRRKSQAKKVVCIPAPAAVNSRPSGEVVPSDLWAWRKYGQKPIKGSPFPRGYYRCSSSKGCSARKQVERSRTDPNMLVITYTSEHNHPWPTQRNALAGSTRSQPTKNHISSSKSSLSSSPQTNKFTNLLMKQENNGNSMNDNSPLVNDTESSLFMDSSIKEEMGETSIDPHHQNSSSIDHTVDGDDNQMLDQGFHESYHDDSVLPDVTNHSDDFFSDLGELEPDLLFSPQGFNGDKSDGKRESKGLDPFSLFDWTGNSNSNNDCFSQEPTSKRGL